MAVTTSVRQESYCATKHVCLKTMTNNITVNKSFYYFLRNKDNLAAIAPAHLCLVAIIVYNKNVLLCLII